VFLEQTTVPCDPKHGHGFTRDAAGEVGARLRGKSSGESVVEQQRQKQQNSDPSERGGVSGQVRSHRV